MLEKRHFIGEDCYWSWFAVMPQKKSAGSTNTSARAKYKPEPEYSQEARRLGIAGSVVLFLTVDVSGKPRDVTVLLPLGVGLDEKAVQAVKEWRFEPATNAGRPVAMAATVEVSFSVY